MYPHLIALLEKADSYEVPAGVRSAAKRGLELRRKQPKSGKAGLDPKEASKLGIGSGVARARDLMAGKVSKETIKRMHRYFSRHAKNMALDPGKKPEEDKGYVAGLLWGGEAGKRFAAKMVARFKREEEMGKARKVPKKYLSGLSDSKKKERAAEIRRRAKKKKPSYKPLPGDKGAKTKPSKYSRSGLAARVRKEMKGNSDDEFLRTVGKLTGISTRILRQVHKRGAAAWSSGHRPGASQQAWARARVYSFATGGKTRRTADKDLWTKHLSSMRKAEGSGASEGVIKPPGQGWEPIPGSRIQGFRRMVGGQNKWQYWYPHLHGEAPKKDADSAKNNSKERSDAQDIAKLMRDSSGMKSMDIHKLENVYRNVVEADAKMAKKEEDDELEGDGKAMQQALKKMKQEVGAELRRRMRAHGKSEEDDEDEYIEQLESMDIDY